jgi:hypothetical protein
MFFIPSEPPIQCGNQWSNSPEDFWVFEGQPYAAKIWLFSESLTARGRSAFDTQARDGSISPGVSAGSGTVQNPLLLSISIFRQCCAAERLDTEIKSSTSTLRESTRPPIFYNAMAQILALHKNEVKIGCGSASGGPLRYEEFAEEYQTELRGILLDIESSYKLGFRRVLGK